MDFKERVKRSWAWEAPCNRKRVQEVMDVPSVEEETLSKYQPDRFYPARIGQCLNGRYTILAKLGYGRNPTNWFCFDKRRKSCWTVKIGVAQYSKPENEETYDSREVAVHYHLGAFKTRHRGCFGLRTPYQDFALFAPGQRAWHLCMVFRPALLDLSTLATCFDSGVIDVACTKSYLKQMILVLDWLHTEGKTIHCDIKVDNVLCTAADDSAYAEAAKNLKQYRPRGRWNGQRFIYESINLSSFLEEVSWGRPMLIDLGEARAGVEPRELIDPQIVGAGPYRAPEIRLGMRWGRAIDIWAVGIMAWFMLHGKFVFGREDQADHEDAHYFASVASVLGRPPQDLLQQSPSSRKFWDENGMWLNADGVAMPETRTLEDMEDRLEGDDKAAFLDFIRSTLTWEPEDRKTAKQLLEDPWLNS